MSQTVLSRSKGHCRCSSHSRRRLSACLPNGICHVQFRPPTFCLVQPRARPRSCGSAMAAPSLKHSRAGRFFCLKAATGVVYRFLFIRVQCLNSVRSRLVKNCGRQGGGVGTPLNFWIFGKKPNQLATIQNLCMSRGYGKLENFRSFQKGVQWPSAGTCAPTGRRLGEAYPDPQPFPIIVFLGPNYGYAPHVTPLQPHLQTPPETL